MSVEEIKAINAAMGSEEDEEKMAEQYRVAFKVPSILIVLYLNSLNCFSTVKEFDDDNSGTISPEELHQMMIKLGEEMDQAEVRSVFGVEYPVFATVAPFLYSK
jgi:hypothetical protein